MKTLSPSCFWTLLLTTTILAQNNPVPLINNPLVPTSVAPGGASFTLTVNGTGFVSGSVVNWNGSALATTFVGGSQLTATVPAANTAAVGTASITVVNPAPAGASNIALFGVRSPFSNSSFNLSNLGSVGNSPADIICADLNNDGKLDLISTGEGAGVYVSLGNGDGTFQAAVPYQAGGSTGAVVVSDLNGDGKLDLAVATFVGTVAILLGNGDGTFQPYQDAPGNGLYEGQTIGTADFNRDGKEDVAVVSFPDSISILLGNGDGTFQNPVNYTTGSHVGNGLVAGDFNGDGNLDLAVTVLDDVAVAILLGNGDGSFQSPSEYSTAPVVPLGLVAADFNGDGALDLAVSAETDVPGAGAISVLLGNGNGTFQTHTDYPTPSYGLITTGDLDGDGNLDLVATSQITAFAVTYLGEGNGTFRNEGYFATGLIPGAIALGDFNGDGMADLATANYSNLSVLLQTTAVLSRTAITFPKTTVGSTSTAKVTFSNIGSSSFTISKFTLNGGRSNNFSQSNNCGKSLAPGASCTITIVFKPQYADKFMNQKLEIGDSATNVPQIVYLSGTSLTN